MTESTKGPRLKPLISCFQAAQNPKATSSDHRNGYKSSHKCIKSLCGLRMMMMGEIDLNGCGLLLE
jgi:hypothetical protein